MKVTFELDTKDISRDDWMLLLHICSQDKPKVPERPVTVQPAPETPMPDADAEDKPKGKGGWGAYWEKKRQEKLKPSAEAPTEEVKPKRGRKPKDPLKPDKNGKITLTNYLSKEEAAPFANDEAETPNEAEAEFVDLINILKQTMEMGGATIEETDAMESKWLERGPEAIEELRKALNENIDFIEKEAGRTEKPVVENQKPFPKKGEAILVKAEPKAEYTHEYLKELLTKYVAATDTTQGMELLRSFGVQRVSGILEHAIEDQTDFVEICLKAIGEEGK